MKAKTEARLELTEAQMREYGYKVVDALVAHHAGQESKKPVAVASRAEMDELLTENAPEEATSFETVMQGVMEKVIPHINLLSHPKFFSFVPGPSNFVSVLADTLATGFNVFSGGWAASPAAAELEIITINWLLNLYGFPKKRGGGIFTSGGSMANLTALVTARNVKCGDDFSKAVIYLSDQAHSSNVKAIRVMGFTKEQIRIIPTDMEFKFAINKLKNAINKDRLEGWKPFCLLASAGTTNTGTVDQLTELSEIAKAEDLWFHIDGAYGGAAILAKDGKQLLKGVDKADSLTVDPHKWFYQPYEMGCLLVRNHKWLSGTFTEKPEYLKDVEGNSSEINFYDHGIQLTRRFRALKFYMSVKTFGLKAFREAIDYNFKLCDATESLLRKSKKWEVVSPSTLAIINFRYNPIDKKYSEAELDKLNSKISEAVVQSREAMLVTTILNGQIVLRMCLINPRTTFDHVKETIDLCEAVAEKI
ncbi:pyridoxal phosphate-dependent decarboxylase family protein [Leeuwenhoekiella sp. H156]|uniref:pyridoxal phosphate-dependent decarboxylase family protein n=1 Tax=Leeuwenhoekiella sp. H156 TaxID=3450128 RepID=UPI003FA47F09